MLTQNEREWLASRRTYCNYCDLERGSDDCEWEMAMEQCAMFPRMKDALEFSERVAAKLATDENCGVDEDCPPDMPYGWGRLKAARLQVEEEMDNEKR